MHYQRVRQKKRSHKRTIFKLLSASICITYVAVILAWPLRAITPSVVSAYTIEPQLSAEWPAGSYSAIGSSEYGLLDASSGSDTKVPIASITKLITSLVVLDAKPLKQGETGPLITLTTNDANFYNKYIALDGSVAPVTTGMQLSQHQIMQAMLVKSANNYADTLAAWAYGSIDSYLLAANAYLKKHNFTNTNVADATGFSPQSVSTAAELVNIGAYALKNPVIADIVAQKSITINGLGTLYNTNALLGSNGVVGIKTGNTDEAGFCLLFASQFTQNNKNITLVGVVLNADNHQMLFRNVDTLIKQTSSQFQNINITKNQQVFADYETPWGAKSKAVSQKTNTIGWLGSPIVITPSAQAVKPGEHSTKIGSYEAKIGNQSIKSDLKLNKPIEKPSMFWRLTNPRYVLNI